MYSVRAVLQFTLGWHVAALTPSCQILRELRAGRSAAANHVLGHYTMWWVYKSVCVPEYASCRRVVLRLQSRFIRLSRQIVHSLVATDRHSLTMCCSTYDGIRDDDLHLTWAVTVIDAVTSTQHSKAVRLKVAGTTIIHACTFKRQR